MSVGWRGRVTIGAVNAKRRLGSLVDAPPDLSPLIGSYAVRTGLMSSIALEIAQTPSGHARRHIASPPPPTCYLVCNEVHGLPTHLAFKFFYPFTLNSPVSSS